MTGDFTALAMALVAMALVASIAAGIFAFEIFTQIRERAIRTAANLGDGQRSLRAAPAGGDNAAVIFSRDDDCFPVSGFQAASEKRSA